MAEYAREIWPLGKEVVLIANAEGVAVEETVSATGRVTVFRGEEESWTCAEKLKAPDWDGMPEIVPVELVKWRPGGSEPVAMLQV